MTTGAQPDLFGSPQATNPGDGLDLAVPEPLRPYLRLGTCYWKHDSWKGLRYDPARSYRADHDLADCAKHLNTVEVDQWFWSLFPTGITFPSMEMVKQYAERATSCSTQARSGTGCIRRQRTSPSSVSTDPTGRGSRR